MGFTPPDPGMPSPKVTPDFLRAVIGARFIYDHIAAPSGTESWAVAVADRVGSHWGWQHGSGPLTVWTFTLDTFRVLEAAMAQPDGTFVLTRPVVWAGIVVPAGTVGRLQATTDDLGHHVAAPVAAAVRAQSVIAPVVAPLAPAVVGPADPVTEPAAPAPKPAKTRTVPPAGDAT